MRGKLRATVLALLLLALAAPVVAQSNISGSVQGTVKDKQGGVLPGVAVTVFSDVLVARKATAVTDERGLYRFPSLPPGTYAVEANLAGFVTARTENVVVNLGKALAIDIMLQQAKVAEAVSVTAEAPVVSVVNNSVSTYIDKDYIDRQPLPRNYYAVLNAAPGVNDMLAYGGTGNRQNAFTLDGVNVADPASGEYWLLPSIEWMQEIQVGGLGANAEYGGYTGGVINAVTKSGGNEVHGSGEYYLEPKSWVSKNPPTYAEEGLIFSNGSPYTRRSLTDAAVTVGGALTKDKLWYFLSGEYWNQKTTPYGAVAESDRTTPRYLGKLTYQLNEANRIAFMAEHDGVTNDNRYIDKYYQPDATAKQDGPNQTFSLSWESLVNSSNFFTLKLTGFDGRDDFLPYNGWNTPGHDDYYNTGALVGNLEVGELEHRHIMNLDGSWSLFADGLFGSKDSHTFKFGVNVERATMADDWQRPGGFTYYDDSSECPGDNSDEQLANYLANPLCGIYEADTGYGEYHERAHYSGLSMYAQDSARFGPVTVNLGFRYTSYKGGWDPGHGNSNVYDVNFVDPRIGFVWDVLGTSRTAVKGHWGRYHGGMFTYLFDREVSGHAAVPDQACYWDSSTQQFGDCDPAVTQAATMGKVDHDYVDEALLTFEQQLSKNTSVGVDLIDRKFRSFIAMVNTNQDYTEYTAALNPDVPGGGGFPIYDLNSAPNFVLTSNNPGYRDFKSAVLRLEKRYADGWQLRGSLVYTDLKGNFESNDGYASELRDLNGLVNAAGPLDGVFSKWEFKLNGAVDLPLGIQASANYTYLSGEYWTPYVRIRQLDYNSSTGRYINLTPRGSQQLPDRQLVDMRLAWGTKLGGGPKLTLSLEVFNLLNKATVLAVDSYWGSYYLGDSDPWGSQRSGYGKTVSTELPREIRAGVRLDF